MKGKYLILPIIVLIAGFVFTSCKNNREQVADTKGNIKEANEDLKDAQAQFEKDWLQFKNDVELKISANEKRINEFKADIKTAGGKVRAKYEKEVAALEQKNIELRKKLSEYKYEGKDNWEEFKKGFNRDLDVVGNALNDIFSKKD